MASSPIESRFEAFRRTLSDTCGIVTKEESKEEVYEKSIERWSLCSVKQAQLIVYPTCLDDVCKSVQYATSAGCDFTAVGGRHTTSGASSRDGGMCIDLGWMRGVAVETVKKTVTVQGGGRWEDVDKELAKYGLATVGGTVNTTGVGGLTLGGGYGYLTGQYGLVIDNLLEATIVLADGAPKICSKNLNADLFWAIRGAGVNFGIVTSFTFQAYELKNPVWAGMIVYKPNFLVDAFKAANHLLDVGDGKASLVLVYAALPTRSEPSLLAIVFYNGGEEEARAFFKPLFDIEIYEDSTKEMPYWKANSMVNDILPAGFRRSFKGSSALAPFPIELAEDLMKEYKDFLARVNNATETSIMFEFFPYKKLLEIPQTATAFANRGAQVNMIFAPGWTDEQFDKECRTWTRAMSTKTIMDRVIGMAQSGLDDNTKTTAGEYGNHDSVGAGPEVIYGANYKRLVELKTEYDPNNFFGRGPNSILKGNEFTSNHPLHLASV